MQNSIKWWKNRKCAVCRKKMTKLYEAAEVRLDTADGVHNIEICQKCADFFDQGADILSKGRTNEE